jgi:signal transduction histidine kinase
VEAGPYNGRVEQPANGAPAPGSLPLDAVSGVKWMNLAAVVTWVVCGLSPIAQIARGTFTGWPAAAFVAAFLLFGAALAAVLYRPMRAYRDARFGRFFLAVQSLSALAMLAVSLQYARSGAVTAAALVIVAAELPYLARGPLTWIWIVAQTAAMAAALQFDGVPLVDSLTYAASIGGFQLFAAGSAILARSHAEGRAELARANDELRATRSLLAETSRAAERVRISRDLHDALGHHLTALSLQLDVASRLVEGKPADHVRQAHAIARLLLADVRDVVSRLRDGGPVDLAGAVQSLAMPSPSVTLHVEVAPGLALEDCERSLAVVRCVQEIITNTARHANARNLWLRLEARDGGVRVDARDDGEGAASVIPGHGLTGMRERFAEHGGTLEFSTRPGGGFEVRAHMPGTVPGA